METREIKWQVRLSRYEFGLVIALAEQLQIPKSEVVRYLIHQEAIERGLLEGDHAANDVR